jgi:hypothetical protein
MELNAIVIAGKVISIFKNNLRAYFEHRANFIETILTDSFPNLNKICKILSV